MIKKSNSNDGAKTGVEGRKRRPDRLRADLVDAAILKEDVRAKGSVLDRAEALERKYYDDVRRRGGKSTELFNCEIDDTAGCGFASPREETVCPFCGYADPPAEAAGRSTAIVPASVSRLEAAPETVHEGEIVDDLLEAKDLDAAIERVREAKSQYQASGWDLGNELKDMLDGRLYLARRDPESGKPLYANWRAFVKVELDISVQHTHELIAIARVFPRPEALRLGNNEKARSLLKILSGDTPEAAANRKRLSEIVTDAKAKPVAELASWVRQSLPPGATRNPNAKTAAATAAAAKKKIEQNAAKRAGAPPPEDARITVAWFEPKAKLRIVAKGQDPLDKKAKRATKLGDGCSAAQRLPNGSIQRYTLHKRTDGLFDMIVDTEIEP